MINEEIEKLLSCNECDFNECRQCEITYTDKKNIREYIEQLENKVREQEMDKQKLIDKLKEKIKYFEECDELIASSNDNYSDGTVTYRFIKEFTEILSIAKGEKQ